MQPIRFTFFWIVCLVTYLPFTPLWAQGIVRGKVIDATTGEALVGATIFEVTTQAGAVADLDGNFELRLPLGAYTIEISYVGYQTQRIEDVRIRTNEVSVLNIALKPEAMALSEVMVVSRLEMNNESALLLQKRQSSNLLDGLSAETFNRVGDRDAGDVLRRITGVSVEGGRYVYVRGLGDRYSKATLNNAEIPSLDPSRNAVQFDIFPSNLIDNIVVYKSFTADLPGDFTGGLVNVKTKEFPEYFTLQLSSSYGWNTQSTFNRNFLTYQGGRTDWLAFDDGTRAIPALARGDIPSIAFANNPQVREQLTNITRSFNRIMEPTTSAPFLNQRHSLAVGNQTNWLGKPLGYVVGISYQTENTYYDNAELGYYAYSGGALRPLLLANNLRYGEQNVLWGVLSNLSYRLHPNHKLALNVMHNQSGMKSATMFAGIFPQNFDDQVVFESMVLDYMERSLSSAQLKGEHYLPGWGKLRIDWHLAYTLNRQDQPDLRMFATDYLEQPDGSREYSISPSAYTQPVRFYRTLDETTMDNKINFILPYQARGGESKLKFGFSSMLKERGFRERRMTYRIQDPSAYNGSIPEFFSDENLGFIEGEGGNYETKVNIQDDTEPRNQYTAQQYVLAAYLMTDFQLSSQLKLNAGARVETTYMELESFNPSLPKAILDNVDLLPAINVVYAFRDNTNLRLSYARTLARPAFRELAPFAAFDFIGDFVISGNPALRRTLTDNFDLRLETYPRSGELFAFSLFFKQFDGAIEKALIPQAQNTEFSFRNVDQALVVGGEAEVRKSLDFIAPALRHFQLALNASYIYSQVEIPEQEYVLIRAVDPTQPRMRPFFAQSPYLLNAILSYSQPDKGFDATASFNIFGPRLMAVSAGVTPNIFEQPRPELNLTLRQRMGNDRRWMLTARANNLLNPAYRFVYTYDGNQYPFRSYRIGSTFTLGVSYTIE